MTKDSASKMKHWFKKASQQLIGNALGNQILPAHNSKEIEENNKTWRQEFEQTQKNLNLTTKRYFVPEGLYASLDTYAIQPKNKSNLFILNLMPNCTPYEKTLSQAAKDADELNVNIITFNYRGVCGSTGFAEQFEDLVQDCKTEVKHLIEQKVPPENIILTGFSLGSAVAALAAKELHQENLKVKVFCDRGFASVTKEVVGLIREGSFANNDFHETKWRRFLGHISKPLLKATLQATNWEANAAKAFEEIPEQYKEYLVIRSRKEKRSELRRDDTFVPYYASLHEGLNKKNKAAKFETTRDTTEGHFAPLKEIHNRYGQSGFEFFNSFVKEGRNNQEPEVKELKNRGHIVVKKIHKKT